METFNGLHINADQEQVEIKICEHLTVGILSPFNKKLEKINFHFITEYSLQNID